MSRIEPSARVGRWTVVRAASPSSRYGESYARARVRVRCVCGTWTVTGAAEEPWFTCEWVGAPEADRRAQVPDLAGLRAVAADAAPKPCATEPAGRGGHIRSPGGGASSAASSAAR